MIPLRRLAEPAPGDAAPAVLAVRPHAPVLAVGAPATVTVASRSDAAPPPGPVTVTVEREGHVLDRWTLTLDGDGPVRRSIMQRRIRPGAGTGPAVLRAALGGMPDAVRPLFLADQGELDALAGRLDRRTAPEARAALPAVLLRIQRLEAAAVDAVANAPLDVPARAWSEIRELADGLDSGIPPSLRRPGAHELAHRSGIDGTLQPYSVFLPAGIDTGAAGPYPLLVALHGSGVTERGTLRSVGPYAAGRGWIVVAPRGRGLSDWWDGDAMTDVLEVIDHVRELYPVDTSRVALAGFSMGGYGAWRLRLRHPERFRKVAVLAGADCPPAPADAPCVSALLDQSRGQGPAVPLLVIHGREDNAVPVVEARRLVGRVEALGWPVEYHEVGGVGHGSPAWWRRAVDWLELGEGAEPPR